MSLMLCWLNFAEIKGHDVKRIVLFIATNFAVVIVINVILSILCALLGININGNGTSNLLLLAIVVGFTGSFISLVMSKTLALNSVNGQIIGQPQTAAEAWLLNTVANQASQWNITMPEVAIYDAPEPNAFATGATRNSSLVAVSTGLLHGMSQDEVEAVLAHEMAHIGNGDMVTMTLLQGVINTFVFFWSRCIAEAVARNKDDEMSQNTYFMVSMILQMLFGCLASLIVMWFSRQREYRADAGAARLVGPPKMIAALQRLKGEVSHLPDDMLALGIASEAADSLFSTHPTLDNRINRLRQM
jgi:heat shock protein HtpX